MRSGRLVLIGIKSVNKRYGHGKARVKEHFTDITYYSELGVSCNATSYEIKRAYRKLTSALHPDRNPDNPYAEEALKRINGIYEVLINPGKRAEYDESLNRKASISISGETSRDYGAEREKKFNRNRARNYDVLTVRSICSFKHVMRDFAGILVQFVFWVFIAFVLIITVVYFYKYYVLS
jgi:curved DNA-binding protein CbpA